MKNFIDNIFSITRWVLLIVIVILSIYLPIYLVNYLSVNRKVNQFHKKNLETHNLYYEFNLKDTAYLTHFMGSKLLHDMINIKSDIIGNMTYSALTKKDREVIDMAAKAATWEKNEKMISSIKSYIEHLKVQDRLEKIRRNKATNLTLFYILIICFFLFEINTFIGKRLGVYSRSNKKKDIQVN